MHRRATIFRLAVCQDKESPLIAIINISAKDWNRTYYSLKVYSKYLIGRNCYGFLLIDSWTQQHHCSFFSLGRQKTHTLFILAFPASWSSSSSSSSWSLSLPLPLPEALLADRGLSCSESDPDPEPVSET